MYKSVLGQMVVAAMALALIVRSLPLPAAAQQQTPAEREQRMVEHFRSENADPSCSTLRPGQRLEVRHNADPVPGRPGYYLVEDIVWAPSDIRPGQEVELSHFTLEMTAAEMLATYQGRCRPFPEAPPPQTVAPAPTTEELPDIGAELVGEPPASPPPSLNSKVAEQVLAFLHKYGQDCFASAISLGDEDAYREAANAVKVQVDDRQGANALYQPQIGSGGTITLREEPGPGMNASMPETIWHELTHRIEDEHGDIPTLDFRGDKFAERHTDYMALIGQTLIKLQALEQAAKRGGTPESLRQGWYEFLREYERGATTFNPEYAHPSADDLAVLDGWFGFHVRPDEILARYQSGACGNALAQALSAAAPNTEGETEPPPEEDSPDSLPPRFPPPEQVEGG